MTVLLLAPAVAVVHQPVTLNFYFPDSVDRAPIVRPSDQGAGGVFSPATICPQPGEDQVAVSYTPARAGPIQIVTDPPATLCIPAQWQGHNYFAGISADGMTLTLTAASPPYGFLIVNGGTYFVRDTYRVERISGITVRLAQSCTAGPARIADLQGVLLTVVCTGPAVLQAQPFWPCQRTGSTLFTRPAALSPVVTGRRSNLFYLGEPIHLRARKGTSFYQYSVRDLHRSIVASGPLNPSEFLDAEVSLKIDRCGYFLVDYYSSVPDPIYGSCLASAPLVIVQRSPQGLMERAAYSSLYGDFSEEAFQVEQSFVQWIAPPGPADVPWYAIATGQMAVNRGGFYVFRISCVAGGCRMTVDGSVLADSLNDPTFGSSVLTDALHLRPGERHDIVFECSAIATTHRPVLEMSLDGGAHWERFVVTQYPSAQSGNAGGLTVRHLTNLFPFTPRTGIDLFTDAACGLGLERVCLTNSSNPGPECDDWEPVLDSWLAHCAGAGAIKRRGMFLQFTAYRCVTVLVQPAARGARAVDVRQNIFGPGGWLRLGQETHRIESVQNGTLLLETTLEANYLAGEVVRNDPDAEDAAVTATVLRLKDKVLLWEFTNEPDQARPAALHVEYMRSFFKAVKAAAPGPASVVLGPTTTSVNHELDSQGYVDVIARAGGLAFIDGFAFHAYNQVNGEYLEARKGMRKLQAFLAAHRASHLPIYQTEQGYQSDLNGVFEPWHQIEWYLAQRLAFDQFNIPLAQDYFWTARDHGDPEFATHLVTRFGLLAPVWPLLRTYSEALAGARFAESYDLGSASDLYVASRYAAGEHDVGVFWSAGDPDGQLELQVSGANAIELRDGWGNVCSLPVVNGRALLNDLAVPAYVTIPHGVTIAPLSQRWGPNLAMSGHVSSSGAAADLNAVNDGVVDLTFFDGNRPYTDAGPPPSGTILPTVLMLTWQTPQEVGRVVIRCPVPCYGNGTLLEYDLQFLESDQRWASLVPLVSRIPTVEAILQPEFNASAREFWDRKHVFHHVLDAPVTTTSIRLRIFAASWGGEACQLSVEAGGQGTAGVCPQISEWQVFGQS